MSSETQEIQALKEQVNRLTWRISTLEQAEFECVRLVEALRMSEARYRGLLEEASFPITIARLEDSLILYANPLACELFGLEGPEPKGRRMAEFWVDPAERDLLIQRYRSQGFLRGAEVTLWNGAGEPRVLLYTASIVTFEGQEVVLATANDITEWKLAEARFRTVVETSPDSVVMVDMNRRLTYVSPQTLPLLGMDGSEELKGRDFMTFVASADQEQVAQRLGRLLSGTRSGPLEFQAVRKDGSLVPVETHGGVVLRPDGTPQVLFAITRDLTGRKRAERALRLAEKLEGLSLMAAGLAHDLNNAFQVVQGRMELALAARGEDPELHRILSPALEGVTRSAELARKMIDYTGTAHRTMAPVDLGKVLEECVDKWREYLPPQVSCTLRIPEPPPVLGGDAGQLGQVASALLLNAVESMELSGGQASLGLEELEFTPEELAQGLWLLPFKPGRGLRLEVVDQGCGIREEHLERVTDPFFTTKERGRGLGLSVALGILRSHGAGFQIKSGPGGTAIRVWFPLAQAAGELARGTVSLRAEGRGILLAEDDDQLRELVSMLLRDLEFAPILEARDGAEALELFRARGAEVSLLLTDATMPKLGGPQLLEALRRIRPGLPAVLMTGFAEEFAQETSASFGFSAYLQKPFRMAALQALLARFFPT